jgi:Xaa-Pro aminopeptidase
MKDKGLEVKSVPNFVDSVWGKQKPPRPCEPVKVYPVKYAGMNPFAKYAKMCEKLGSIDLLLVTALDQIAWILNLRGNDIEFNPVFFSYLVWSPKDFSAVLFCDEKHFGAETKEYLDLLNCKVQPYGDIVPYLQAQVQQKKKIGVDLNKCNSELRRHIATCMVEKNNVVELLKACKTQIEVQGMQEANTKDCAAIMKYFAFLEEELAKEGHGLDEYSGAEKVLEYRRQNANFVGPSFDSISSVGANGAVIHYKPEKDTAKAMNNNEIYLLDSGGQYLEGTTDITRTAHFGGTPPTEF